MQNIRELFPEFKGQIRLDRTVYKLAFGGKNAREILIKYLLKHPLSSHKSIVFNTWLKAHKMSESKQEN